jgi:two-component system invasion response regulator UvrY
MQNTPQLHALNLLLIDDHQIVREGLKRLLSVGPTAWAITEAGSGHEALEQLRQRPFKLAIVDLSMPGMNGLDLIKRMKSDYPATRVLVLSMHAEDQYAIRAFKIGAGGYLVKDAASSELQLAATKVASGGMYVSSSMAERVVMQLSSNNASSGGHETLSNRELEVLQRIVAGQRLTEIANDLHLSVKTVSTHKANLQQKLQLPNMAALIRYGIDNNLGPSLNGEQPLPDQPESSM